MAERRTRHHDSPRRRRRESTKAIIDQDEVPRSRAPYRPAEIPSSYSSSSSSSSYIDISRTFPPNRPRGLGAIRAFFTSPSEHRRRARRRTSRPYLRAGTSSSSSVNTDLAYGTGYIRRRKGDRRRGKGKEREPADRPDPRAERDPDAAILEVGAGLAALARKQNRLDLAEARKLGIAPPRRDDSSILRGAESSRGLGSSKISHGPDEEGWESATDADSETSSVDSRLAYGHGKGPGWGGFFQSRPKRKDSVVDPALFGPANSLHGIIDEPVGFDDVDHDNLSDYPPPTIEAHQKEQIYPPPVSAPQREQSVASGSASATGPLQYVYPVPTSDPNRFDAVRGSDVSAQEAYGSRPAPVPIQQASVEIQQPQPKPIVSQSVFEPSYSTRSEPKVPSSSGRTKSSVAGAALAGVTGAVIGVAASSNRRDERKDRDKREDGRDPYDGDRRADRRKDEPRERPDMKEGADDRREKRRERDRDEPGESREERRERRRREKRDDPDYERREKRREKRRDDGAPEDNADKQREEKYSGRPDDRDEERRTRKDDPIVSPIDPFQYQVADDAFETPDGTRNSEPFTGIQRARSPAVVTVERVPHWHRDASTKEETVKSTDDNVREKDWEARDRKQTEREAETLYEEIEHSTIPVEASAVGAAIAAEEHRHSREKVRKRRYDRSGDTSPTGERDPIQEEADRIYREAVLARKIAESKNEDPVNRIVTPPEMAHKKDKEVLYPVPNADFELDHVMDPVEFMTSPIKGSGEGFDRIKSLSGMALEDLHRPLLTLVRPTPTPSPAPEEQKSRSKRKDSSREAESSESKRSESGRKESSRDVEPSEGGGNRTERKDSSRDSQTSEPRKKPTVDTATTEAKGDATQTPASANGTKGVTWGENDTKHYEVESPYETKDDPIATSVKAADNQEKPKMSKERKASAWGALRGAFMSGAAAEVVAKATEASKDDKDVKPDGREKDVKPERTEKDEKPERKESSRTEPFEYKGFVVEPEHSDNKGKERGPPAVGPKPSKMPGSNMPGAFDDDLDFTATLAAGLEDSGFDPDIVIKDPTYRRRSSPPGSEDPALAGYKQPYAETVSDLSQYAAPITERSRDIKAQDADFPNDRIEKEQKKLDKAAKRQSNETRDLDLSGQTPTSTQVVEEPESFLESSKSGKKEKKRDKTRKSKDSYDDVDDRSNKRVSVPVDAFDDLRAEAVQSEPQGDWDTPKKSKRKSKRDSDQFDPPSRSMSASDITSSVEPAKKKSKDKSSKRSSQYDSEPNPEDVPLPSASEISRDDDYDSRKSKRSSKRSSSIPDVVDRDARSVKSDSSRYADDDESRSSKKEKRSSGFFSGIFGSSTSKSEPDRSRDMEESEPKKKSKKSKRSSIGDGSEIYGSDAKSDIKSSPNGNGYKDYDGEGDPKRSMNGDSIHGKTDEKEESFLDNAGTLGAGVGLAAAIALAAQHQQSKAATAEIVARVPRRSTPEHTSSAKVPAVEASREVFEDDIVDPEIVRRQFRPSIDPQYGDLLPLPPSDPGSPNIEADDALPSLPESRPNTPPRTESVTTRDRSVGSSRRSELPALVKTPSHSAVPIKFIMGNRSTPSSPGLVRAPSVSSPSTMSPDTLGFHRARPRPTSWDSTKEIQPLYLLDPSRRAPASQSTESEVQSPVAEDAAKSTQIEAFLQRPEVNEELPSSDARDFAEEPQSKISETNIQGHQNQDTASTTEFLDHTTLPPLPNSRSSTPVGQVAHESDLSSLPALPESGTTTPTESSDVARLPQLPESKSSTSVEDRSLKDSDLVTVGVLTGAALGLSAGALVHASSHDEPVEAQESAPKSTSTEELPAEFQVEPITKDRSSYLFQATPPAKRTKDIDTESLPVTQQGQPTTPSRIVEEVSLTDDVTGPSDSSPTRTVAHQREATLEALTKSVPDEEEPLESAASTQPVTARESEVDAPDDFFTKSKKNKKKGKKNRADQFGLEEEPSSSTITPPSLADSSKDITGPPEFSLKKSKKDKKKDKKRASSQWDAEDEPSDSALPAQTVEAAVLERDIVEEPSQSSSAVATLSPVEPAPEEAEVVEEFSRKKSKKDKRDKKRASTLVEPEDEGTPSTVISPLVASSVKAADPTDEPLESLEPLSATISPYPFKPAEDLATVEEHSPENLKKDKSQDQENALDFVDPKGKASVSAVIMPSVASTLEDVETVDNPPQPMSETVLPSPVEPADDADTPAEFSLKKSKKDKKKDKKKALELTEGGEGLSTITALPSFVASAAQEADPSDEYSSTTSKKDKKKDKMKRKSLSRSSTLAGPSIGEAMEIVNAKDEDLSIAEQTPLPVSRALSDAEATSEVGEGDLKSRNTLLSQEENLQSAEPFTEPVSTKESKKSKKKGRKSPPSWELDEPSTSEAVSNEPITEAPLEREANNLGLESKQITDIQPEPQVEPQEVIAFKESKKDKKEKKRKSKSQQDWLSEEPSVSGPVEEEQVKEQLVQEEPFRDEALGDEPVNGEQVQKDIIEAEPGRELPLPDKPAEKDTVEGNIVRELRVSEEPITEELGNRDLDTKDSGTKDTTATEDDDQSKLVEPLPEFSSVKDSKKSKKKKGKSFQAWQDDEAPGSQAIVEPVSEPAIAAPSEREDLSGFSTPTSKFKGKKKQKRKSIAWDVQEPEPEPAQRIAASDLITRDAPIETDPGKGIANLPQSVPGEAVAISKDLDVKEELGHVQEPEPREDVTTYEPKVATEEREISLQRTSQSALSATPKEPELSGTARSNIPGVEYFPSAAALHSRRIPKNLWESVETGYFPSAVRLLPAAAPIIAMAPSFNSADIDSTERSRPEDVSLSTTGVHDAVAERLDTLSKDIHHEDTPVDEPSSQSRDVFAAEAQPLSPVGMRFVPEPVGTHDLPKQSHVEYFPSAAFLHSPSSAGPSDGSTSKAYFPSATILLPLSGAAAVLTAERQHEKEPMAKDLQDDKEPLISHTLEHDEQPLPAADHKVAEATIPVPEKDVLESMSQEPDEEGADSKPSTPYSEEQLEAARQLNAEFGFGKKRSKKSKKGRADLSRTSTQEDEFTTGSMNEPEEAQQQIEPNRDTQTPNELQIADGLAAGYNEDQVALAKQLQAEYESNSKKSKKGKKSRSASRTPRDYDSGPSFSEEPEAVNIQVAEEASREIIPDDEDAPKKQGPDGLAAGFTEEQLEAAREMKEAFASGSKKSKKDKKRKGLIRSATDENISGPAAEGGSEEISLATTEVDSATDSPYPLSTVPTPDDFKSSFTTKKGKKGKKRQSLLRSSTQDSEDSAGPSREIAAEPQPTELATSEKDVFKAADTAPELIIYPEDKGSSATADDPETSSFSTKKEKKGKKKRQSLLRTTAQEEPSSDPTSGAIESEPTQKEIAEANTSQPPDVVANNEIAALGEELNFSLKKSKKDKKGKKGKDIDEVLAETGDVSQPAEQDVVTERGIVPEKDRDQGSLADRIWAGVMPSESLQPENENPSAESEDPLGFYTTKKSKKNKTKSQAKSTSASEPECFPVDRHVEVPIIPADGGRKEAQILWADEVAEAEVETKQPELFNTWSFSNLPDNDTAQEISSHEPQTMSKDVEVAHEIKQEEAADIGLASRPLEDGHSNEALVQEQQKSTTPVEAVEDLETPPPVMPKTLAWEDEPALQQQTEVRSIGTTDFSAPDSEGRDDSDLKSKAKHKPVSAGILAAGAALLAGASTGHIKEPTGAESLSTVISRSSANESEANTPRPIESKKKREKRPAKLLDRRSFPKDDLFDDPMLWEGAEAQKFGDHAIDNQSGDEAGFWSAPLEKEESTKDEFAVDDVEEGPSSMPHKRERSVSLMEVWEPSTVLDHVKTPRKHQHEDVPAAIARDAIIEQEIAEKQTMKTDNVIQEIPEVESAETNKPKPASQWNDVPEEVLTQSSKKAKKDKKQSRQAAWDAPTKDKEADTESSYTTTVEPPTPRDIDEAPAEDQRITIIREATNDHGHERYRDQESGTPSSSGVPLVSEDESYSRRNQDEETFQSSTRRREESAKVRNKGQEIYLPPTPTVSLATEERSVQERDLDTAPSEPPSENRAKDKHRRQEFYLPPPSTLPIVIEEEDHKPDSEHVAHERGINDNNRDSAFVTESPVPFQRRIPEDHEYARDSGVHLRDWGDTPVTKDKSHVASADDALARLSWPAVDEETETVDLKKSQRPKDERSPKRHTASPALVGAVAVSELAHLAARSPPQKRDEHGENAKFDRSITPNMGRLQTPDHSKYRPGSVGSNRSSGTPPLRRSDRKLSGDLRSLSQRSQANLAKEAKDAKEAERSPASSIVNINPTANEGRPRVKDMADVYDGYGEGRIGSPMSPTRPHSMRRRQSMQVLDLEARIEQLDAENRMLAEAKELAEHSLQSAQRATLSLADRDAEVDSLKQTLDWLHREVERLKEVNDGLTSANITLGRQHNERYGALESQHADATRELEDLRQSHRGLSGGVEDVVLERVAAATEEKDREIAQLRQDLEAAHERIRELQREILRAKDSDNEFLVFRDEDYFDNACQQLCQHVQQWVLRFSKFSDMRACRRTNEINNDKIIDRLDNAVLDGSDVDEYLSDRIKRRDIFMSMTMTMIWEFVFTRYLFGMDREQRQKLKSLEKTLLEVGPPAAVHQWRATTLTLLSKRDAFQQQREQDTVAVVQMIFQTLSEILPPPTHLEEQIQEQLMRVMKAAVDLSIEMRTQRAEYMMLPPLQPEYDANGDLARQVQFNAALMNERSGDTVSNEELEAQHAVVRIVLFPLVVKKGDDTGGGDDEIVVCPAQVLVAKPKRHARGLTPDGMGQNPNHSRISMQSSMPIDQHVPDI